MGKPSRQNQVLKYQIPCKDGSRPKGIQPSIRAHLLFGRDDVKAGHVDKQPKPGPCGIVIMDVKRQKSSRWGFSCAAANQRLIMFGHEGVVVGPVANLQSTERRYQMVSMHEIK